MGYKHFQGGSSDTKALLLSTFMKFINMYDELNQRILAVFKEHHSAIDPEIQQRSVEYSIMAQHDDQELITTVWEAMPDFPERDSPLMRIINKQKNNNILSDDDDQEEEEEEEEEESSSDEEDESEESEQSEEEQQTKNKSKSKPKPKPAAATITKQAPPQPQEEDFMSDLFGGGAAIASNNSNVVELVQDKAKLLKLLLSPSGVLFENDMIQIGFRSQIEIPGGVMKVLLYYGNKCSTTITIKSIECTNTSSLSGLGINFTPISFDISPKQQSQQQCKVSLNAPLSVLPKIKISFSNGTDSFVFNCDFPVIASKFFKPHVFEPQQFKQRWQQLKNEKQQIIQIKKEYDANKLRGVLSNGMSMGLIAGVDQNPNNAIGCSVYHFAKKRDDNNFVTMPVLLRLEFNPQNNAIRVTVRSPHLSTTSSVLAAFIAVFKP